MGSSPSTNSPSSSNEKMETELIHAIKTGDKKLLSLLRENHELCQSYNKVFSSVLLHCAIFHGQEEWLKFLTEQKIDINSLTDGKETPLHSCVRTKYKGLACAKILLKAKADINCINVWGRTPLMEAIVQFRFEIFNFLLSEGADVNISDMFLTTPLHVCASYGNVDCLKNLLDKGANQNAQDERGRTPLYFAITGNHMEVISYLIENGCNVNLFYPYYGSPLQKALTMSNTDLVLKLIKSGASTALCTSPKLSSLRLSLTELTLHTVQTCLESCSSVCEDDLFGPMAKTRRHIQCFILLLVAHGLPVQKNVRDKLRLITVKYKSHVFKKELQQLVQIVNAMSRPKLNKGPVNTLQNLARFNCRQYLMTSKHNVIWACDQMDIPTVLTNILTFKL